MWRPTRRRVLAGAGSALVASSLVSMSRAQTPPRDLRIGLIAPSSSGLTTMAASLNDLIGDAARQGALSTEATIGNEALENDLRLIILPANAPSPEAASRAGRRLVATGDIDALIGGVGEGQADALGAIAEEAGVPFFNVGSPRDALRRGECRRFTFHIEASAAMYLDTIVDWGAGQGYRRWFIVYEDSDTSTALRDRAVLSVDRHGDGGEVVGAASASPRLPYYGQQLDAAAAADADAILVLLSDVDQISFVAQQENVDEFIPLLLFPFPNTQTRDYIAVIRQYAPVTNPNFRFALWDTTLEANGAGEFNTRYITRWGDPVDPPAWAAYQAVRVLFETVKAIGSVDGPAIVDYLENSGTEFDLLKGPGTSFRPWDHQLRQPLYLVRVDQDAVWDRNLPTTRVAIASAVGPLPDLATSNADPIEELDRFGDGPEWPNCRT
jgi:branched-chain amino acid transport system substrate-binding protein